MYEVIFELILIKVGETVKMIGVGQDRIRHVEDGFEEAYRKKGRAFQDGRVGKTVMRIETSGSRAATLAIPALPANFECSFGVVFGSFERSFGTIFGRFWTEFGTLLRRFWNDTERCRSPNRPLHQGA